MTTIAVTTVSSSKDLETSIDSLTAGALPYFRNICGQLALENPQNAGMLCQYLITEHTERNIKLSTRIAHIISSLFLKQFRGTRLYSCGRFFRAAAIGSSTPAQGFSIIRNQPSSDISQAIPSFP